MKKIFTSFIIIGYLVVVSCSAHVHTIGDGPQSDEAVSARQWYVLFGLVPLNSVDVGEMSDGASDYEINTRTSFIDAIIGGFTGMVTVSCRSVTVTK